MSKCERDMAWAGRCREEATVTVGDYALCLKHSTHTCWCGEPAIRDCSYAGSFVCGRPLCVKHHCNYSKHSAKGEKQYAEWKMNNLPRAQKALEIERINKAKLRYAALEVQLEQTKKMAHRIVDEISAEMKKIEREELLVRTTSPPTI